MKDSLTTQGFPYSLQGTSSPQGAAVTPLLESFTPGYYIVCPCDYDLVDLILSPGTMSHVG